MMQDPGKIRWRERRRLVFSITLLAAFALIEMRLFFMQVINRPDFLRQADANHIRAEAIEPTRGSIYDRNGNLLVENRPSYTLYAHPWTIKRNPQSVDYLAAYLATEKAELENRIGRRGWFTFQPVTIQRDVAFAQLAHLETMKVDLPGIAFGFAAKRSYLLPEAVHLLGYVGEPSQEESREGRIGLVGKHGIEKVYEKWLGGEPGINYLMVDVSGKTIGAASSEILIPPVRGWDVFLNIDAGLQRYAYNLMAEKKGAVVAIDPRDGSVLAMLSQPDYDPALFAGVMSEDTWNILANDPGKPLLNRALQGTYPPGSTFKMAVLAAALEKNLVDEHTEVTCTGIFQIGNRPYKCWKKAGHGVVGWRESIKQSCDVFYYTLGLELELESMSQYAKKLGFGTRTDVDIDGELSGLIPDKKYMDGKYGKNGWTRGQFANIAIGQGDVLVTPIQLAVFTAALATGKLCRPRIVDHLVNRENGDTIETKSDVTDIDISTKTLQKIRDAMRSVVNETGGTAAGQKRYDIVLAGKTGTSQNPHGEDHALFVGFAPFNDPQIAVAVVVEHGEHGSSTAAPIAAKMMEYYIHDLYPGPIPRPPVVRMTKEEADTIAAG